MTQSSGDAGPTDQEVGAYYDDRTRASGLARLYRAPTPLGAFYRGRVRLVRGLLESVDGDLLDIGCGTGQMLASLRGSRRFTLTGLDRSAANLEVASRVLENDPEIRLVLGRIEELPFADASFDTVLAMGILEYVTGTDAALAELARVLRPGGRAVVTMQNPLSPYRLWDATIWSRVRRRRGQSESPVLRRLGRGRLGRAAAAAGLEPVSVVDYGFNVLPPPLDAHFPRLATRLEHRLATSTPGPLRRLASDYVLVARRAGAGPAS